MSATHRIHVLSLDGCPEVWLDTEVAECDGICLGTGDTLAAAKADAVEELAAALARVQAIDPDTFSDLPQREWTDAAKQRRAINDAGPDLFDSLTEFVALYDGSRDMLSPDIRHKLARAEAALAKAGMSSPTKAGTS